MFKKQRKYQKTTRINHCKFILSSFQHQSNKIKNKKKIIASGVGSKHGEESSIYELDYFGFILDEIIQMSFPCFKK